jgi:hypothetical protein
MIEMALATPAPIENTAATSSNETKNTSILNTLVIGARGIRRNLLCAAVECQDISGTEYLKRCLPTMRISGAAAEDFRRCLV